MTLLTLFKIACAQLPNKVMFPTDILAVSETFVVIQSVLASRFYSPDREACSVFL